MAMLSRFSGLITAFILGLAPSITWAQAEWPYAVKPGDTLIGIAADYLAVPAKWPQLQTLNKVADPRRLQPGTRLRIPVALLKRDAAVAEVIFFRGSATRTPRNGQPAPLTTSDRLQIGDVLETGADAAVSLRFVDGSRLLLAPNSSVTLVKMMLFGKTGMAQTILDLHHGSIEARVSRQQEPAARYEIKSRALNLTVRGTEFRAHVANTDQFTRNEVISGAVHAAGLRGKAVMTTAGFGTFAAPGDPPRTPQKLVSPPDLSKLPEQIGKLPLRFEWPAAEGAVAYRVQVFQDGNFDRLMLDDTFETPTAKWANLPDGHYVLRVRGKDSAGLEGLNADRAFVLKARPEPPFVITPLDGQKSYGPEAHFRWSSSPAQRYRLQLAARPDFSSFLVDQHDITDNERSIALAPGQYYWRIASIASGQDQGPFSDVQGFTQRRIPASPALDAPRLDDRQLQLSWRQGAPGERFQLQLARDREFTDLVLDKPVSNNLISLNRPEPGTYFLRVKTVDADGFAGNYGAAQQIEVPASSKPWWLLLLLLPLAL